MKVKIMDYETAKAEALAREQNPYIANDKRVWGVDNTWAGWGQVRDVEKRFNNSFCDVEDGYVFPSYLIDEITNKDVLRYGEIIINEEFVEYVPIRIRIISYDGSIYYHKMVDGKVVDFKPIGLTLK